MVGTCIRHIQSIEISKEYLHPRVPKRILGFFYRKIKSEKYLIRPSKLSVYFESFTMVSLVILAAQEVMVVIEFVFQLQPFIITHQ